MNLFPQNRGERKQHGQTLPFLAVTLACFVLFAALAIDFGLTYLTRARLTKAMDAACLNAARSYTATDPSVAQGVAISAFYANYGAYARDTTPPAPTVTPVTDPHNPANTLLNCSATATSNTIFARLLPNWQTISVTANAQSKRATLVMTLVLDRSGSMSTDGGWTAAVGAIPKFLTYFDNAHDYIGMVSFASTASINAPITGTPGGFCSPTCAQGPIMTALNGLRANGYTFAQGGLSNGLTENNIGASSVTGNVFKAIIFLTDGYANIINDNLSCPGYATVNYGGCDPSPASGCNTVTFMDPSTGNTLCSCQSGGTPSCCTATTFFSAYANAAVSFTATNTFNDSEYRALQLANQLRTDQNPTTIYSIGLGNSVNQSFLKLLANDPSSPSYMGFAYNSSQPTGAYISVPSCTGSNQTACNSGVLQAFQNIAANILLRLTQ